MVHVHRDALWEFGGRAVPNAGFGASVVVPVNEAGEASTGEAKADENADPECVAVFVVLGCLLWMWLTKLRLTQVRGTGGGC